MFSMTFYFFQRESEREREAVTCSDSERMGPPSAGREEGRQDCVTVRKTTLTDVSHDVITFWTTEPGFFNLQLIDGRLT